jgi:quinol monooxygenase YgiN
MNTEVKVILFHVTAMPGKRQELVNFLKWDREESMDRGKEPGTIRFDFFQDPHNGDAFYVYEAYENDAAFKKHQQHKPFKCWDSYIKKEVVSSHYNLYPPEP